MRLYHAFGGSVVVWRQSADAYVPATVKRARGYSVRAYDDLARVTSSVLSVATTSGAFTAAGVASVSFGGTAVVPASMGIAPGVASTSFVGSSLAAGGVLASGSAVVSFASGDFSVVVPAAGQATVAFSGVSRAAATTNPAVGSSAVSFTGESVTPGGGTADPADVWNFVLPNGKTAGQTVMETHAMMAELYRIHGLQAGAPLVVDKQSRTAGDIEQSITQVGDVVTVTRTG